MLDDAALVAEIFRRVCVADSAKPAGVRQLVTALLSPRGDEIARNQAICIRGSRPTDFTEWPDDTIRADRLIVRKAPPAGSEAAPGTSAPLRLDLAGLAGVGGQPLPPLLFVGCEFAAPLDLSDGNFTSVLVLDCVGPGIVMRGSTVAQDFKARRFWPRAERVDAAEDDPESQPSMNRRQPDEPGIDQKLCCQLRLSGSRIGGTLDLRRSKFRSPSGTLSSGGNKIRRYYADQFAIALDNVTVGGRVLLGKGMNAIGGITLFQADIARDVLIDYRVRRRDDADDPHSGCITTHTLPEEDPRVKANDTMNRAAIDAKGIRVGESFEWRGPGPDDAASRCVSGRIELNNARICGNLAFRGLVWRGAPRKRRTRSDADGGIDCRGAQIDGQLYFDNECRVTRRSRHTRGLRATHSIGVALDLWKAELRRGVLIEHDAKFYGAIQLNQAKIDHQIAIHGKVTIDAAMPPINSPYHVALDMSDARLTGNMVIELATVTGRVSFERMDVQGSLEIRQLAFDLRQRVEPLYDRAPPAKLDDMFGEALTREGRCHGRPGDAPVEDDIAAYANRQRFDETSLLDLQDLSLAGGINIKRNAVRMAVEDADLEAQATDPRANAWQFWRPEKGLLPSPSGIKVLRPYRQHWCQFWRPSAKPWQQQGLPPNNYIIDLRGLSCVSWDDADGTAWHGLAPFQGRGVPWRLRMQGLSFARLDSSSQVVRIERGTWFLPVVARSHMVISAGDETSLRIKMLRSYYQNRNETLGRDPWMTRWPFDGPPFTTHLVGDFLRGWFRWTLDTSRQRLERYPPFNPQAYETFARAYLQRGDIEAAVTISITRLSIMWRKRLRSFCRRLNVLHVFSVVTGVVLAASGLIRLSLGGTFLPQLSGLGLWFILALLAPLALYLLLWAIYLVIDWGFGFGLRGLRAICTMVALALLAAFATPLMMGDPALPADRDRGEVLQQLLYGIDKTLPVVETRIALYPPIEQTPLPTTQKLARPGTLGKAATQPPVADKFVLRQYTKGHGGATRFAILDTIWEILGWIVTSAAIFTVVGFARRDIER